MRKLFKERKLFKGGNYMRNFGILKTNLKTFVPPLLRRSQEDSPGVSKDMPASTVMEPELHQI